jgi:NADPH-dependent 2,4-dienoyl-CoA reductase/sulfur reductase-like enzyme
VTLRAIRAVRPSRTDYGPRQRVVVVGAGPAGWAAATELRRLGFTGDVLVFGAEPLGPYDRTACSKGLLSGQLVERDVRLDLTAGPDVRWQPGERAVGLDVVAQRVDLDGGQSCAYDGLIIATGSRPTLPAWWPADCPAEPAPGLHPLHDLGDALAVRRDLFAARRVAVVGGGLTGCEVACAVLAMARRAVLVNPGPHLMARALGEPVGALVTAAHRAAGMDLRLGRTVVAADRFGGTWRLLLDDGEVLQADVVVLTAGERPDIGWLADAGLDTSDGVLCDEALRVVGPRGTALDGVVAAGAVARWPNLRYGGEPARLGQWISALEQGQAAARTLLAGADAPPVTPLPRFWSDQFALRIQVCGRLDRAAEVGLTELRPGRRDVARAGVIASYSTRGRLTGVVAVNAPRAFGVASRMLAAEPVPGWFDQPAATPVRLLHAVR